jgi:hypothetical protein
LEADGGGGGGVSRVSEAVIGATDGGGGGGGGEDGGGGDRDRSVGALSSRRLPLLALFIGFFGVGAFFRRLASSSLETSESEDDDDEEEEDEDDDAASLFSTALASELELSITRARDVRGLPGEVLALAGASASPTMLWPRAGAFDTSPSNCRMPGTDDDAAREFRVAGRRFLVAREWSSSESDSNDDDSSSSSSSSLLFRFDLRVFV